MTENLRVLYQLAVGGTGDDGEPTGTVQTSGGGWDRRWRTYGYCTN